MRSKLIYGIFIHGQKYILEINFLKIILEEKKYLKFKGGTFSNV